MFRGRCRGAPHGGIGALPKREQVLGALRGSKGFERMFERERRTLGELRWRSSESSESWSKSWTKLAKAGRSWPRANVGQELLRSIHATFSDFHRLTRCLLSSSLSAASAAIHLSAATLSARSISKAPTREHAKCRAAGEPERYAPRRACARRSCHPRLATNTRCAPTSERREQAQCGLRCRAAKVWQHISPSRGRRPEV